MRSRLSGAVVGACGLVALVVAASSCSDGDDLDAADTLAPIQTTSTTSTTLPTTTTQPQYYEVQPGDTLTKIAAAFGLPIPAIMELNGIVDPNAIQAGQILQLPLASDIVVTSLPTSSTVPGPTALPAVTTVAP
ncbi:MAG: LysM domain-containing protein [Ilumatobacteraceae bacterium]